MLAKELRVTLRVKNNRLISAREGKGLSQAQAAAASGVNEQTIAAYETIRKSPIHGDSRRAPWRPSAVRLAAFYGSTVEEMWPDAVLAVVESRRTVELDGYDLARFAGPSALASLAADVDQETTVETRRAIEQLAIDMDASLSPMEAHVLRCFFGLDGEEERTLEAVGTDYNLSRERIRQVKEQALAKLRRAAHDRESAASMRRAGHSGAP